jgi:hypothetical protein
MLAGNALKHSPALRATAGSVEFADGMREEVAHNDLLCRGGRQ